MNDQQLLNMIMKNSEMGCIGIDGVIKYTEDADLIKSLSVQRKEYDRIYKKAFSELNQKGCRPEHPGKAAVISSEIMSFMKTASDNSPSRIAEMMIKGSTMGVTKIIKGMSSYSGDNHSITSLADKLLKTEQNNIEEMKKFL
ncbi:MAG: hypothetical protein ACI4I9_02050 [Porcipelethomonas sp.]